MMAIAQVPAAVVASLFLIQGTNARLCRLRPNQTDANYADWDSIIIHSQDDIDTQLQGCTTIEGGLAIASDYTGSFSLPGVNNLIGDLLWQFSPPSTPGLTSFNFPDMENMFVVDLQGLPALTSISMPKVEQLSTLSLLGNSSVTIDCGSLANANTIIIEGTAPKLNFTSLQQVEDRLSIQVVPDTTAKANSSDLVFPALRNATSISLTGHIASLSMPNLEVALSENSGVYTNNGIEIENYGDPLVLDFPLLYNASGIKLTGYFESMSFPSLLTLNGVFTLEALSPFAVNLYYLQSVLAISLGGKISSFSMPAIQDIQTWVEVTSEVSLDCGPAHAQWLKTNSSYVAGTPSNGSAHVFSCESSGKKPMSTGVKVGLAVGLIVLLAVLFGAVVWSMKNWWRWKAKNNAQGRAPISDHELGHVTSPTQGERPPSYKPYPASVHSEIGPLAEPKDAF